MNNFLESCLLVTIGLTLNVLSCKHSSKSQKSEGAARESFRQAPREKVEALNKMLDSVVISRPEDVADIYKPALSGEEGRYVRRVSARETGPETLEIILEETGLPDDAVEGIQILFQVKRSQNRYTVERIQEAYRCYRGHKSWTAEPCP